MPMRRNGQPTRQLAWRMDVFPDLWIWGIDIQPYSAMFSHISGYSGFRNSASAGNIPESVMTKRKKLRWFQEEEKHWQRAQHKIWWRFHFEKDSTRAAATLFSSSCSHLFSRSMVSHTPSNWNALVQCWSWYWRTRISFLAFVAHLFGANTDFDRWYIRCYVELGCQLNNRYSWNCLRIHDTSGYIGCFSEQSIIETFLEDLGSGLSLSA